MGQGDGEAPAAPRTVSRHPPGPHITTDSRPAPHRDGHPPANSAVCVCWTEVSCQGHGLGLSASAPLWSHGGSSSPCPPPPRCPDCPLRKCGNPLKVSLGVNTTDTDTHAHTRLGEGLWAAPLSVSVNAFSPTTWPKAAESQDRSGLRGDGKKHAQR